jgi:peptidoglycan/LPS O-acetylase OafA/YrhL
VTTANALISPVFPQAAGEREHAHVPVLDGIRGLAVLMVMVFHFFQRNGIESPGLVIRALTKMSVLGQTGVDLFFVLSGFLITGILLKAKGKPHYFRNFYMRRTVRIFPLHYFALIIVFVVLPVTSLAGWVPFRTQLWGWFYGVTICATFFPGQPVPLHFWSLAVEEHFYLVWPAVVRACSARKLALVCAGCMVGSLVMRIVLLRLGYSSFFFTLCRLDGLAVGALMAIVVREPNGFGQLQRYRPRTILAVSVLAFGGLWVMFSGAGNTFIQAVKGFLAAVMYGSLVGATVIPSSRLLATLFASRLLRTAGKYSYGLYVWDGIIQGPLEPLLHVKHFAALVPSSPGTAYAIAGMVQAGATIVAALLSWQLLEKRFLKLKTRFGG